MPTNWRETDERLIRRGELILELSFVENYPEELKAMNKGKEGRPYKLTPTYIQFLTAIRYLYGVPYHQLEGFTRALHILVPQLPSGDYSGLRKRSLALNPEPYRHLKETDEPITIAVDSTGIKVHRAGGWVERKHGKKKRYVKLHFVVDVKTKEVVAMEISPPTTCTTSRPSQASSKGRRRGGVGSSNGWATGPTTRVGSMKLWRLGE